jgi:hypothetical protein
MLNNFISKQILINYKQTTEITYQLLTFSLLCIHTIIYQTYDKNTPINPQLFYFICVYLIYIFINDYAYTLAKSGSKDFFHYNHVSLLNGYVNHTDAEDYRNYSQWNFDQTDGRFTYILPLIQYFLGIFLFYGITIESSFKSFVFYKFLFFFICAIKTPIYYYTFFIVCDIIRLLVEDVLVLKLMLIVMTDPYYNDDAFPNIINGTEIYLRYFESLCLVISLYMVHRYENIDDEVRNKKFTSATVTGKYDSLRYPIAFVAFHFYFILVNGMAYSWKYMYGLVTVPLAYWSVLNLAKKEVTKAKISLIVLLVVNLCIHFYAFLNSYPNEGRNEDYAYLSVLKNNSNNYTIFNITFQSNKTEL